MVRMENIVKSYGAQTVLTGVTFEAGGREIFGLLGSNGCGKTTTIRALLGLIRPTGGELLVGGEKFSPDGKTKVGYLPEERGLYRKETVIDIMVYFGKMRGLKNPRAWSIDYLKRVGLDDKVKEKMEKLSSGQQQKAQLGITMMGSPDLLILDEPTKGFDPVNRRLLMDIIGELHQKGTAVLMITHYMDEVERLCDRILLMKNGTAKAYGTIAEIKKEFGGKSLDEIFVSVYKNEKADYFNPFRKKRGKK